MKQEQAKKLAEELGEVLLNGSGDVLIDFMIDHGEDVVALLRSGAWASEDEADGEEDDDCE